MAFEEDGRPWIRNEPLGTLVVMLLGRMAFNMLALFQSVTQRSEERRKSPWRDIMGWMHNAVITIQEHEVASLRTRQASIVGG